VLVLVTRSMSMTQNSQQPLAKVSACGLVGLVSKFTLSLSSESYQVVA